MQHYIEGDTPPPPLEERIKKRIDPIDYPPLPPRRARPPLNEPEDLRYMKRPLGGDPVIITPKKDN